MEAGQDHTGPGTARAEIFSQFGIIDFGCMTESCCIFDLSTLLSDITLYKEIPPIEYKEHMRMFKSRMKNRTNHDDKCDGGANVINYESHPAVDAEMVRLQDEASETTGEVLKDQASSKALGDLPEERTPNKAHQLLSDPSDTSSHEPDGLVLAGHAIAGYLTTSSLTDLEWEVLLPSLCSKYIILLVIVREMLGKDNDNNIDYNIYISTGIPKRHSSY